MLEHDLQNQIRVGVSERSSATLFRANVGMAWTGKRVHREGGNVRIEDARPLSTGLPKGFPDLFGLRPLLITPEMVGQTIAQFVFIEVKQPKRKPTETQRATMDFLIKQGACGGVAHSAEEAVRILNEKGGVW